VSTDPLQLPGCRGEQASYSKTIIRLSRINLCLRKRGERMETVPVSMEDLSSWAERLESLRKCMLEPEKCTHEGGCDYAAVDSCLDQIISEMEQYLK